MKKFMALTAVILVAAVLSMHGIVVICFNISAFVGILSLVGLISFVAIIIWIIAKYYSNI